MSEEQSIDAVLFDLDGTLLDTAPDMAAALNVLRDEEGSEQLAFDVIRAQVSHGGAALVRLGFPGARDAEFERLRARLLDIYARNLARETCLFPGLAEVLDALGREPVRCLYVGDAERDVRAAHAAGMRVLIARYGYLGPADRPEDWRAEGMIDRPTEILTWMRSGARSHGEVGA